MNTYDSFNEVASLSSYIELLLFKDSLQTTEYSNNTIVFCIYIFEIFCGTILVMNCLKRKLSQKWTTFILLSKQDFDIRLFHVYVKLNLYFKLGNINLQAKSKLQTKVCLALRYFLLPYPKRNFQLWIWFGLSQRERCGNFWYLNKICRKFCLAEQSECQIRKWYIKLHCCDRMFLTCKFSENCLYYIIGLIAKKHLNDTANKV